MAEMATEAPGRGPWQPLDVEERRVLGVLAEKAKTTPDAYPLSLNAVVTGCNQKSNRDPVLNLSEDEVEQALVRCQKRNLAIKVLPGDYSRVTRWKHDLYTAWHLDKKELAVLAELLLRGPQTEGELRTRASRMEPFDDLDALRAALRPLVERKLVVYLTPEERRGAVLTHGFHAPAELERLKAHQAAQPPPAAPASHSPVAVAAPRNDDRVQALEAALTEARGEIVALKQALAEVRASVGALEADLRGLRQSLGA
jgi:uncharacterized protein YceH (UPF0502 family)